MILARGTPLAYCRGPVERAILYTMACRLAAHGIDLPRAAVAAWQIASPLMESGFTSAVIEEIGRARARAKIT